MTQASVTRINKNKKKGADKPHPTTSFAQSIGNAQLNALKPYIQEQIALTAQQITQGVYQFIMQERAAMQTRQLAFERILSDSVPWFNAEILALEVAAVEDEAQGLVAVTSSPVTLNDKVRLSFTAKPTGQDDWMESSKLVIHAVGRKGPNGVVQTHDALEDALLGMNIGDTKEFQVAEPVDEGEEPKFTQCRATVARISRVKDWELVLQKAD